MSTTGGVFLLRPTFRAVTVGPSVSTGSFNLALRFVSGVYSGGGGVQNTTRRKTLFPRRDVRFVDDNGYITDQWHRHLQFMYEQKLGGDNAPSLPDVQTTVASVQTAAVAVSGQLSNVVQVVENNAAVQSAATEVLVATAAPGAAQIPPPVLTVPIYVAPPTPATTTPRTRLTETQE
jgi:hypothetical protein